MSLALAMLGGLGVLVGVARLLEWLVHPEEGVISGEEIEPLLGTGVGK